MPVQRHLQLFSVKTEFVVGYSGSSDGITDAQVARIGKILRRLQRRHSDLIFIHGDCVGGDAQAHRVARKLNIPIEIYPCDLHWMRANCRGARKVFPIMRPLTRNKIIARRADLQLITPKEYAEVRRSGTWSTYRYAKAAGTPINLILPDG